MLDSSFNSSPHTTVESPSSPRTGFLGNHQTVQYTKSTNENAWCYEVSTAVHTNTGTSFDECLPQLEIDERPLTYRQHFQSHVNINK